MFIGEYRHALDTKGRLAIPAKFRTALAGGCVVTRGLDACLFLFTKAEWEKLAEKITNLPLSQSNSRAFARLMLAGAMDCEVDGQGRILLPDYLRRYASLGKQAVIAGLSSRLEIWDAAAWDEYKRKTEASSTAIAEQLGSLNV